MGILSQTLQGQPFVEKNVPEETEEGDPTFTKASTNQRGKIHQRKQTEVVLSTSSDIYSQSKQSRATPRSKKASKVMVISPQNSVAMSSTSATGKGPIQMEDFKTLS